MKSRPEATHLPVQSPWRYELARLAVTPYVRLRGVEVSGIDNLPTNDEPYILAANHRSVLDVPVLGTVLSQHDGTQLHYVTKKELTDLPVFGGYIRKAGGIRFDRDLNMSDQTEAVEAMSTVLQNHGVLEMFPEHTRREGSEVQIKKKGLGILAVSCGTRIATAGIYGTENAWGRIYLNFGKTIDPGPIPNDLRERRKLMVTVESDYKQALQEALDGAYERAGAVLTHAQEGGL